jgi:hypothetical protein
MEKIVYDFRGKQSSIFRLAKFEPFGLIHALSYRILLFLSLIYGFLLLASLFYAPLGLTAKYFTIAMWILITPQLFEAVKAFSLVSTHGAAFGKFSEAYSYLVSRKRKASFVIYKALPYLVIAVWAIFFVLMLFWWPI